MNYDYIENLVRLSKADDTHSKEKLLEEFRPFIINLSKKTFIHGYEFEDIMNECYGILLKCISLYKMENHRFVAYAVNGIKNNINYLIRSSLKKSEICGTSVLTIDNYVEETCRADIPETLDILCSQYDSDSLKYAIKQLSADEMELIKHIFYQDRTLKSYTHKKGVCYSYAVKKKKYILDKLFMHINIYNMN